MNLLIDIAQMVIITFVLSDLAEFIGTLLIDLGILFKKKISAVIFNLFVYLLICKKCFSFWASLILSGSLVAAASVAIIINILEYIKYKWFNKTQL